MAKNSYTRRIEIITHPGFSIHLGTLSKMLGFNTDYLHSGATHIAKYKTMKNYQHSIHVSEIGRKTEFGILRDNIEIYNKNFWKEKRELETKECRGMVWHDIIDPVQELTFSIRDEDGDLISRGFDEDDFDSITLELVLREQINKYIFFK